MKGKNEEFVAYIPDLDCKWLFTLEMNAGTINETATEMLDLFDCVLKFSEGFIDPKRIEYTLHHYQNDESPLRITDSTAKEGSVGKLISENGINQTKIRHHILNEPVARKDVWTIYQITIDSATTRIQLADGDTIIDSGSDTLYRRLLHDGVSDTPPSADPITIKLRQGRQAQQDTPRYFLTISTSTDIWFEDSEIGASNRKRLGRFLTALQNHPNVVDADFHSSHYGTDSLRSKGYDELVPDL